MYIQKISVRQVTRAANVPTIKEVAPTYVKVKG